MSDDSFSFNPFPDPDVFRDRNGERVARIEHRTPGIDWLVEEPTGQELGRYEQDSNRTYDGAGAHFGFGNLLMVLLGRAR